MAKICAYCGEPADTDDHVVPKQLYPESVRKAGVQLLTVPACKRCNGSFSDDEEHFRNVLTTGGKITSLVGELFYRRIHRSFAKGKSLRHLRQLVSTMQECQTPEGQRHIIYPIRDKGFVRILHKILRGLAFHHFGCPVPEENVSANVLIHKIPPDLREGMVWYKHCADVFQYWYGIYEEEEAAYISFWVLRFFDTRDFIGKIDMTDDMYFDKANAIRL
ncbi:MAG: hypothetical protein AMJ43_09700 [Coxiella sp. DG_40]|nr:MAG: hypothetical protein AMJ43_09700 [Coxiella sp. DG_40]